MKKVRKQEHAKERHGETCMCRKCRAKIEAMFYRKGTKTRVKNFMTAGFNQEDENDN